LTGKSLPGAVAVSIVREPISIGSAPRPQRET